MRDRRGRKLWIVCAHAPTEIAEDNSGHFGIDANAKTGLEQQSDMLGKCYYPAERTSDNGDRLVDLCEQAEEVCLCIC
ncbi:hypothetical protein RB195_022421 [Necator americanus]|uniref:Thyroglobulin type-1 domain-containing protein n=1 Tax=Necator americanus TaxID=51031 RepID=A0ABR1EHT4_NECAM